MASFRKLPPNARWPMVGMIAGMLIAVPFVRGGGPEWPAYVLVFAGMIIGFIVNAITKRG